MHTQHGDISRTSVLLTGATGFVGRFLLSELLDQSEATIYCLVRGQSQRDAAMRIRETLTGCGLWHPEHERRIVALPGDLRQPRLGLCEEAYDVVVQQAGSIFHCGASVNHLETYEAAKAANVRATNELLKIAAQGRTKFFHHISTVGVFARNEVSGTRIVSEDTPIEHERHRRSSGYAASKWVAESMVLKAQSQGMPCSVYRLGLLWADSRQGRFDEQQHVYRLMKSCLLSGYGIENYTFQQDPVPVDFAARAIVALSAKYHGKQGIFHIASSVQAAGGLFEQCNRILRVPLRLMPYYDWILEVKRLHHAGRPLPMVPLLDFAFSMDREEFAEHLSLSKLCHVRADCQRTSRELAEVGVSAPPLYQDLLAICLDRMDPLDTEFTLPGIQGRRASRWLGSCASSQ